MLALFKPGGLLVLLIRGLSSGAVSDHSVQTGPGRGRVCVVWGLSRLCWCGAVWCHITSSRSHHLTTDNIPCLHLTHWETDRQQKHSASQALVVVSCCWGVTCDWVKLNINILHQFQLDWDAVLPFQTDHSQASECWSLCSTMLRGWTRDSSCIR